MQELRDDALTGTQVIVAPRRGGRPEAFGGAREHAPLDRCPFCAGNEAMTPPETARVVDAADPSTWRVRAFPNLYPVVGDGVPGAHEIVVLSPAHDRTLADLDPQNAIDVLVTLRDRAAFHLDAGRAYVQVFVNEGAAAGASLDHPHAQLVAVDLVPPAVDDVLSRFAGAGRDLVADEIDRARASGLVVLDRAATAWCPYASASPYAVRVALPYGRQRFDRATDDEVAATALALRDVLRRGRFTSYNLVVHTAPRADPRPFHWWVDLVPRVDVVAGFELGTGILVNTVAPHDAAAALRHEDAP